MIAAVFAMQPLGQLCAYAAGLTALQSFGHSAVEVDKQWRYVVGIGGIPTLLALGFRLSMPEGGRYLYDLRGITPAPEPPAQNGDIICRPEPEHPAADTQSLDGQTRPTKKPFFTDMWEFLFDEGHWRDLFGTSICWLLLDFAFCKCPRASFGLRAIGMKKNMADHSVFPRWTRFQQSIDAGQIVVIRASQFPGRRALLAEVLQHQTKRDHG